MIRLISTHKTGENHGASGQHAVSFTADTSYLDWNTKFPAITVCEDANGENQWDLIDRAFGSERDTTFDNYLAYIAYFTGNCIACLRTCDTYNCSQDFRGITKKVLNLIRANCAMMFEYCSWNGVEFSCCDKFLPLETEFGICYAINSVHTRNNDNLLMSNRSSGPGRLVFRTKDDIKVFFHAPEDVPFYNIDSDFKELVFWGSKVTKIFTVIEIDNDPALLGLPVDRRGCRFPDEDTNSLKAYQYYSHSVCMVQCRLEEQLQLCNCTHHLMPEVYAEFYCDLKGLTCLTENEDKLLGVKCDCEPSCTESDYNIIHSYHESSEEIEGIEVEIKLQALPTLRYARKIVRTTLDLVGKKIYYILYYKKYTILSIGGIISLFFGASVLSLLECCYFLFFRKW
ncbi:sodium channel protein Nach-like [Ctenocephalides felis]|uniref:sodium channel protein Nach-like n=1 Tax=Ctenocephalides felis TaxID=7515 RepID=UPI000E6E27F6|nr:sodium channel protein Nach-like [Ctenocephalides felis]